MRKFKIKIKCVQEMEMELPAEAYGDENITAEKVAEMEEENVMSDPTYFNFNDNSTINVEVDVDEVRMSEVLCIYAGDHHEACDGCIHSSPHERYTENDQLCTTWGDCWLGDDEGEDHFIKVRCTKR